MLNSPVVESRGRAAKARLQFVALVAMLLMLPLLLVSGQESASAATGGYEPITPARLLDTRPGAATVDGQQAGTGALGVNGKVDVKVLGRGGVPASGVSTVVLNVTAVAPTANSHIIVWPSGETRPNASSLNLAPGQTYPNTVTVKVGADGKVSFNNGFGSTHLVVDVIGWFPTSAMTPITPARLLDTRPGAQTVDGLMAGVGKFGPKSTIAVKVLGRGGVPTSGVAAVVVNLTGVQPSKDTFLSAHPGNTAVPTSSSVNVAKNAIVPNMAVVRVGTNGSINVSNANGSTDVVMDVTAWLPTGSTFNTVGPTRILDTRETNNPLGAGESRLVTFRGQAGIPSTAGAVVVNVAGTAPTADTFFTAYQSDASMPNASILNMVKGDTRANMTIIPLGPDGAARINNGFGQTHLILDVVGYFNGMGTYTPAPPPPPSITFNAIGDSGMDVYHGNTYTSTVFKAMKAGGGDFNVYLGDFAYQTTPGIEKAFCDFAKGNTGTANWLMVPGNHEGLDPVYGGPEGDYLKYVSECTNGVVPSGVVGNYPYDYYVDRGNARLIFISPNISNPGGKLSYRNGTAEQARLGQWIDGARSAGKFTIVSAHEPYLTVGEHRNTPDNLSHYELSGFLITKKADLFLAGHDHNTSRSHQLMGAVWSQTSPQVADPDSSYVSGNGTVFAVLGAGGHNPRPIGSLGSIWKMGSGTNSRGGFTFGYGQIKVQGNTLTYTFKTAAGPSLSDSFTITK